MNSIKKSLPKWIHDEFESLKAYRYFERYMFITADGTQLSYIDLINDDRLKSVWESIGKAKQVNKIKPYFIESRLGVVLSGIRTGLLPPQKWDLVSSKNRKDKAKRIRLLCTKLESELAGYVDNGQDTMPPHSELYGGYGSLSYLTAELTTDFAEATMRLHPDSELGQLFKNASVEDDFTYQDIIRSAFWYAINRTPDILETICSGVEYYADTTPEIYRPNDPGAQRKMFAQRVTNMFVKNFGRPYRDETWVLTGIFFDVGELESSYLSKIAKVKKTPPN